MEAFAIICVLVQPCPLFVLVLVLHTSPWALGLDGISWKGRKPRLPVRASERGPTLEVWGPEKQTEKKYDLFVSVANICQEAFLPIVQQCLPLHLWCSCAR